VEAEEDLIARILAAREAIESRPRFFKSVRQKRGRRFEELIVLIGNNIIENSTQNIKQNKVL
jgi:hypothetical protein